MVVVTLDVTGTEVGGAMAVSVTGGGDLCSSLYPMKADNAIKTTAAATTPSVRVDDDDPGLTGTFGSGFDAVFSVDAFGGGAFAVDGLTGAGGDDGGAAGEDF